jgi:UDP-2,3-diacylglucosamine pyrophosphatase LpxH
VTFSQEDGSPPQHNLQETSKPDAKKSETAKNTEDRKADFEGFIKGEHVLSDESDNLGASPQSTEAAPIVEIQTPDGSTFNSLKAFIVSDVHLNNHPYNPETQPENPRRKNFRLFLTQLNEELEPNEKVLLILNGDILDITGSWNDEPMPWDPDHARVEKALCDLVQDILENNEAMTQQLQKLLQHPLVEIVYVFGNHDGLLQLYPKAHQVIRDFLGISIQQSQRMRFVDHFFSEDLELYVEHGHRFDPFNKHVEQVYTNDPPLGDVINVLLVNRFVEVAVDRLRDSGYSEALITRIHLRLHDIEYLRPLALLPVWIQTIAHQYHAHPENTGKTKPIDKILKDSIAEILANPLVLALMVERLKVPHQFLTFCIHLILQVPAILPMISFVTSKLTNQGHSNKYQYKAAQKIYHERGCRLIVFGHTHIPAVLPLSESAYYFNTGSWKPVINLFKYSKDPVELEYLNPEVQFNKVERSGILRIEKHDLTGRMPADFSLQTIQSGLS